MNWQRWVWWGFSLVCERVFKFELHPKRHTHTSAVFLILASIWWISSNDFKLETFCCCSSSGTCCLCFRMSHIQCFYMRSLQRWEEMTRTSSNSLPSIGSDLLPAVLLELAGFSVPLWITGANMHYRHWNTLGELMQMPLVFWLNLVAGISSMHTAQGCFIAICSSKDTVHCG